MKNRRSQQLSLGFVYSVSWPKLFTKNEIDEFIDLYDRSNPSEQAIHDFLKNHPKFLSALGAYESVASEVSFHSNIKDSSGRPINLRPDFLLRDINGIWDVVELKQANFSDLSLIVGQAQRRRFASFVENGIAQVKTYLRELDRPEAQKSLSELGIIINQPQAWLIIGRDKDLPLSEKRLLERDLPRQLRIITYDQLCNLAKERALIVTTKMLLPAIENNIIPATNDSLEAALESEVAEDLEVQSRLLLTSYNIYKNLKKNTKYFIEVAVSSYLTKFNEYNFVANATGTPTRC